MIVRGSWALSNTWGDPTLTLKESSVRFEHRRMFGGTVAEIPYSQIAAVTVGRGAAASTIVVETTGGRRHELVGASHEEAEKAASVIQERVAIVRK